MADKGFDLSDIGDVVGDLVKGGTFDVKDLEPIWEGIRPTLAGLPTNEILDTIGTWAKDLELPLLGSIPDSVIDQIKDGVEVPLGKLLKG